ncbi:unnamed protein product [Soboliphyme baturini]|uniref:Secreted protein n=1 Tax=Soboliphyme baturini TaxID=241478 RepID=A0A183ISG1_9BILA|nr:unnamed protein product [Soboliphyme baturini]
MLVFLPIWTSLQTALKSSGSRRAVIRSVRSEVALLTPEKSITAANENEERGRLGGGVCRCPACTVSTEALKHSSARKFKSRRLPLKPPITVVPRRFLWWQFRDGIGCGRRNERPDPQSLRLIMKKPSMTTVRPADRSIASQLRIRLEQMRFCCLRPQNRSNKFIFLTSRRTRRTPRG